MSKKQLRDDDDDDDDDDEDDNNFDEDEDEDEKPKTGIGAMNAGDRKSASSLLKTYFKESQNEQENNTTTSTTITSPTEPTSKVPSTTTTSPVPPIQLDSAVAASTPVLPPLSARDSTRDTPTVDDKKAPLSARPQSTVPEPKETSSETLVAASQPMLKFGYLNKNGGQKLTEKWQKRFINLSRDTIRYSKSQSSKILGTIELKNVSKVETVTTKKTNTFGVFLPHRTYWFNAQTQEERISWMTAIQSNVKLLD